jgi:hypothetical protein
VQLLNPLLDAGSSLVLSHHRLAECLHTAGLINQQAALAVRRAIGAPMQPGKA